MAFDYNKLKGRIVEVFGTQANFAKRLGISERTLSLKLGNKIYFRQDEINQALQLLHIKVEDAKDYFFTIKVQDVEHTTAE